MLEELKVSPALVIVPVGLAGLGILALTVMARAAPPGLIGDLNDDGAVAYDDLTILVSYIGGVPIPEISPLSEVEFLQRADVNGDGVINALDITALEALIVAPPVCTIGETKCEGYNLYECQPVNGATQWVLIEENSLQCGYVPGLPGGEILEITWWDKEEEVWRPISDPLPGRGEYHLGFKVLNTGPAAAFKVGVYLGTNYGPPWMYSRSFDIGAGSEGFIDWPLWFGRSGREDITFHLFSDDTEVDSMTVRITVL